MIRGRLLRTTLLLIAASALLPAGSPVDPINRNRRGLASKGYDATAYFQHAKPSKGSAEFAHTWNGATWHFESAQSRDLFKANPEKYAPQYGGYCAWAVSNKAGVDPEAWKIIDGKLYLNYSKSVQRKWEPEAAKRITGADRNWPGLHK